MRSLPIISISFPLFFVKIAEAAAKSRVATYGKKFALMQNCTFKFLLSLKLVVLYYFSM